MAPTRGQFRESAVRVQLNPTSPSLRLAAFVITARLCILAQLSRCRLAVIMQACSSLKGFRAILPLRAGEMMTCFWSLHWHRALSTQSTHLKSCRSLGAAWTDRLCDIDVPKMPLAFWRCMPSPKSSAATPAACLTALCHALSKAGLLMPC